MKKKGKTNQIVEVNYGLWIFLLLNTAIIVKPIFPTKSVLGTCQNIGFLAGHCSNVDLRTELFLFLLLKYNSLHVNINAYSVSGNKPRGLESIFTGVHITEYGSFLG